MKLPLQCAKPGGTRRTSGGDAPAPRPFARAVCPRLDRCWRRCVPPANPTSRSDEVEGARTRACEPGCYERNGVRCSECTTERRPVEAVPRGPLVGEVYQISRILGRGGFAFSYLAWYDRLGMPVAIKGYFPSGIAVRTTEG